MNLTDIKPTPCDLMDQYDIASRDLHRAILSERGIDVIKTKQEVVLKIRNVIAKKLHEHSWCNVPEDQRR